MYAPNTYKMKKNEVWTLSPPNKLSSSKFLVCFNFQSATMMLKIVENIVQVSNSLDPGEEPRSQDTLHLIRIQAVCIWHYGCDLRAKG